ncbi:MAG: phosphoribosyl-AMP cyclohydrolase [Chloroflexi bacterium]|nr:phosphoribosyl-AMP cyclohydrolase [Chloroflexota bacterium]
MSKFKKDDSGLVAAIVQDAITSEVLMLGYMNDESIALTMRDNEVWFYSRSRQELWHKGATSGNTLSVVEMYKDCDADAILIKAKPAGPTCHTGNVSCFYRKIEADDLED